MSSILMSALEVQPRIAIKEERVVRAQEIEEVDVAQSLEADLGHLGQGNLNYTI